MFSFFQVLMYAMSSCINKVSTSCTGWVTFHTHTVHQGPAGRSLSPNNTHFRGPLMHEALFGEACGRIQCHH